MLADTLSYSKNFLFIIRVNLFFGVAKNLLFYYIYFSINGKNDDSR